MSIEMLVNNSTNTTLTLAPETATLGLALTFCILLFVIGFKMKELWILAGPIWIYCGFTIFISYGVPFMVISAGLGSVLLFMGVLDVWK